MPRETSIVGKPMANIGSKDKAMGEAEYAVDIAFGKMLYGKILRSPYPHARILNIDIGKAQRLPGVKAVVTSKDNPTGRKIPVPYLIGITPTRPHDPYPLAVNKVRHIGEAIAAVAAEDESTAEEAIDLIEVEYEDLPAVFDIVEAMKPDAPRVHEEIEGNILPVALREGGRKGGDVERGFKESDYIREDRFISQMIDYALPEGQNAIAKFDPISQKLTIWGSIQFAYWVRIMLANLFDLPFYKVRVIQPHIGGGYGAKGAVLACHYCAALLSKVTGRYVKIVDTREELFYGQTAKHSMAIDLKTGVKKDGRIMALDMKAIADAGAYAGVSDFFSTIPLLAHLLYNIPNLKIDAFAVHTNKPPVGPLRGAGNQQVGWALEQQMAIISTELGIDHVELVLKNGMPAKTETVFGCTTESSGFKECVQEVTGKMGWKEKKGKLPKYRGIGLGCAVCFSGGTFTPRPLRGTVRVNEDGSIDATTVGFDPGSGQYGSFRMIVAEELGVLAEKVNILVGDTDLNLTEIGDHTGNNTSTVGLAFYEASREVRQKIFETVASRLEASPEDMAAKESRIFVKGSPSKGIPFNDAAKETIAKIGKLEATGSYYSRLSKEVKDLPPEEGMNHFTKRFEEVGLTGGVDTFTYGASVAEVEVDPETGKVKILDVASAYDLGFILNPLSAKAQATGGAIMGISNLLFEEVIMDNGQVMNPSLLEYKAVRSVDVSDVKPILVESNDPLGPYGMKEMGMGVMFAPSVAVANAIYDATGVVIKEWPISPEKIMKAIEETGDKTK